MNIYMIDIDTWPIKVSAGVLAGGFLTALSCLLGRIYISRKYLDRLLVAFARSPEAKMWERVLNQGVLGKMLLVSILAHLVVLSRRYIRTGEVSAQDILELPRELRRVLLVDGILMCVSCAIFAVICILMELRSGS